jgi:hypothetical protein
MQSAMNFRWWFVAVLFCCSATLIVVFGVVEGVDWVPICLLVSTLSSTRESVERGLSLILVCRTLEIVVGTGLSLLIAEDDGKSLNGAAVPCCTALMEFSVELESLEPGPY